MRLRVTSIFTRTLVPSRQLFLNGISVRGQDVGVLHVEVARVVADFLVGDTFPLVGGEEVDVEAAGCVAVGGFVVSVLFNAFVACD
jgi:hypothetical protein